MYRRMYRKRMCIGIIVTLAIVAALAGGVYYALSASKVQNVFVEGNAHYTTDEIKSMVMTGPLGDNSLYLAFKYKDKQVRDIPFIASLSVEVVTRDTIRIRVYEKSFAGYVEYLGKYLYFDKDGTVIESSDTRTPGVPQVTGLNFDHIVLGSPLPVENRDIFYQILTVTKTMQKFELCADKIDFGRGGQESLWFGGVKVILGEDANLHEKIGLLQTLLPRLDGKAGTLDLSDYNGNGETVAFRPE